MEIIRVKAEDFSAYERFMSEQGAAVHQSMRWGEFWRQRPQGGRYFALAAAEGKKWLGTCLITKQRLPMGLCWFSIARGPVIKSADEDRVWEALFEGIKKLAHAERAVFVRIELPEGLPADLLGAHWRPAHAHYHPDWTLKVDLLQSQEDILAQMKPKGRYNIRVAEKKGVTVRATRDPKDVSAFYNIFKTTGERDGFAIHPEKHYQQLVECMKDGDWGTLFLAEHDGKAIGGIIVTFYNDTGMYYYGASSYEHRSLMAPYLTQWTAILESQKRGCQWYDFMGIAPPNDPHHSWVGITRFKSKFGGEKIQYEKAREFVFKPFWYWVMRLRKALPF